MQLKLQPNLIVLSKRPSFNFGQYFWSSKKTPQNRTTKLFENGAAKNWTLPSTILSFVFKRNCSGDSTEMPKDSATNCPVNFPRTLATASCGRNFTQSFDHSDYISCVVRFSVWGTKLFFTSQLSMSPMNYPTKNSSKSSDETFQYCTNLQRNQFAVGIFY